MHFFFDRHFHLLLSDTRLCVPRMYMQINCPESLTIHITREACKCNKESILFLLCFIDAKRPKIKFNLII